MQNKKDVKRPFIYIYDMQYNIPINITLYQYRQKIGLSVKSFLILY